MYKIKFHPIMVQMSIAIVDIFFFLSSLFDLNSIFLAMTILTAV